MAAIPLKVISICGKVPRPLRSPDEITSLVREKI